MSIDRSHHQATRNPRARELATLDPASAFATGFGNGHGPLRPGESVFFGSIEIAGSDLRRGPDVADADGDDPHAPDQILRVGFALDEATGYCLGFLLGGVPCLGGPSAVLALTLADKAGYAAGIGAASGWDGACTPEVVRVERGDEAPSVRFRERLSALGCGLRMGDVSPRTRGFVAALAAALSPGRAPPCRPVVEAGDERLDGRREMAARGVAARRMLGVYHAAPQASLLGMTPAQAWDAGVRRFGVRAPPGPERLAALFEREVRARVWPSGLRVMGLTYAWPSPPFAARSGDVLDVRVDPLDLGAVSVRVAGGWRPVPCVDPGLIGVPAHRVGVEILGYRD